MAATCANSRLLIDAARQQVVAVNSLVVEAHRRRLVLRLNKQWNWFVSSLSGAQLYVGYIAKTQRLRLSMANTRCTQIRLQIGTTIRKVLSVQPLIILMHFMASNAAMKTRNTHTHRVSVFLCYETVCDKWEGWTWRCMAATTFIQ